MIVDRVKLTYVELCDLLPSLYFYHSDIDEIIGGVLVCPADLHDLYTNLRFLNELSQISFVRIWLEVQEISRKGTLEYSDISSIEYERQCLFGRVKVLMYLLYHLSTGSNFKSKIFFPNACCELFDVEAFEFDLIAILSAILYRVPGIHILPDFIAGYIKHTSCINYRFIERIFRNFPSEWHSVWNRLVSMSEQLLSVSHVVSGCCYGPLTEPDCCSSTDMDGNFAHRIECVLRILLRMNTPYTGMAAEYFISTHSFPALLMDAVFLLAHQCDAAVFIYLKRLLLDSGAETRLWITAYLKKQTGFEGHLEKLTSYFMKMCVTLIPYDASAPLEDDILLKALVMLRVLAALRGFVNYSFPSALSSQLLTLLTHHTVKSELGSQYITYALAFMIGLRSSLSTLQDADSRSDPCMLTENRIISWLQRLIGQLELSRSESETGAKSHIEPLLLLAILFHTNQPGPITDLISNMLGLRIPSLARTVNGWRKIFLQSVFTENMIATQAAQMSITRSLSRKMSTNLPIQCILQLLKSHAFAKYKLEIKRWIVDQIYESVRPIHPLLPDLIEAHVTHSFGVSNAPGRNGDLSSLISESELLSHFSASEQFSVARLCISTEDSTMVDCDALHMSISAYTDLTPSLLFLYYAIFVYDYQMSSRIASNRHCVPGEASCVYSDRLWECIPITYLLQHSRAHLSDYGPLYPRLLQFVTNHFPHLTFGELMIQDELLLDSLWCSDLRTEPFVLLEAADQESQSNTDENAPVNHVHFADFMCTPAQLDQAFDAALWEVSHVLSPPYPASRRLIRMVHHLYRITAVASVEQLLPFGSVFGSKGARLLLDSISHPLFSNNRRFLSILENLWRRLHLVMPRWLDLLTVNALGDDLPQNQSSFTLTARKHLRKVNTGDFRMDPVENLLNAVNHTVFRCPPVLRIFLRILESNLLASRSYWGHRLLERVVPVSTSSSTFCTGGGTATFRSTARSPNLTNGSDAPLESPVANYPILTPTSLPSSTNRHVAFTDEECERLCSGLLLTQNATVVQLLLEHCLPKKAEMNQPSEISVLREIRNTICTYIHCMLITEPALAEVIVWQTYPHSLLPTSVQAIPSLHICLDHVLNVFRLSGDYTKLVFCLDMVSHLSLHYNIQAAFERAAFMIDSLYHLLTAVVSMDDRPDFLQACLSAFIRLGGAFQSLAPLIARLLLSVGALITSSLPNECLAELRLWAYCATEQPPSEWTSETSGLPLHDRSSLCLQHTTWTLSKLIHSSSAQRNLYYIPEPPFS